MYDKELIEKVCDLTFTKDDLKRKHWSNNETEHPFKTYYSISRIQGALEKYIHGQWDYETLEEWTSIYGWLLSADYDEAAWDLNSFERFFKDIITLHLDGFSDNCDDDHAEYAPDDMQETLELFQRYDHIWQTRDEWRAVYAMIGPFAKHNGDQFVLLINDARKEYMIIYSDHLENGYTDEYFKFVNKNEYVALVEQLKKDGYTMLSCSEEYYCAQVSGQ